jgi:hypothetical protein
MNQILIDKRFDQIEGKIKILKFLLSRNTSAKEFEKEIDALGETIDDLKSLVERNLSPLRNG